MMHAMQITFVLAGTTLFVVSSFLCLVGISIYKSNKHGAWSKVSGVALLALATFIAAHAVWIAWLLAMAVAS